ncbi:bestrophin family ion channel [Spirosoma daeguense]
MHSGRKYSLKEFILWTRRDIYWLFALAVVPTVLYQVVGWKWLGIPWVPIAMIGTAAAFIVGFKNNATYSRLWEARQIYGGIVNLSRTWGIMAKDFINSRTADITVSSQELHQISEQLILRHVAWLTAMRFQLREARTWENLTKPYNAEYRQFYTVAEHGGDLAEELKPLLSSLEAEYVLSKKNRAVHLISLQSKQLSELAAQGLLSDFRYVEMAGILKDLYDQQGKCERIKNFPYPRQFASINLFFIRLFVILVPFGLLQEFAKMGEHFIWLTIPFSVLVSWVFNAMERVGESTENPFEGGANDVPITAMSRGIEIDLREMLDQSDIPSAIQPVNNILT